MKKRLAALFLGVVAVGLVLAPKLRSRVAFYGTMASETALTYSKNYVLDLSSTGVDRLSVQVSMSTPTPATVAGSFTDGSQSTFSVTLPAPASAPVKNGAGTVTATVLD